MKRALLIGYTHLLSLPKRIFFLWSCGDCGNLFHTSRLNIFKLIDCPSCKNRIELRDVTR